MAFRKRFVSDLLALGIWPGGSLLVHSSLRSLGSVPGGAEEVIQGLLEALGPEGTLLMPALSYASVGAAQPEFDLLRTPSCVGALPEYFRTRPGTFRSLHPTHSVCGTGPGAGELLGRHSLDSTPCGANSPFRLLGEAGGQILFLGCGLRPNTSMHGVEELVEPPYLFEGATGYECRNSKGEVVRVLCRNHGFRGVEQRYDRLAGLLDKGELRTGTAAGAPAHLVESGAMWRKAAEALKREPMYFVDRAVGGGPDGPNGPNGPDGHNDPAGLPPAPDPHVAHKAHKAHKTHKLPARSAARRDEHRN